MKTIRILFILMLYIVASSAVAYETLAGYNISCDSLVLYPNAEYELILKVTSLEKMRCVFQVDVTLSPDLQLIADESQNYCQPIGKCDIVSSYNQTTRRLRILATKNSIWPKGSAVDFACIKVRATSSASQFVTITFNNMVFMNLNSEIGNSGEASTVNINISNYDITYDGIVDIADVNAILNVMLGRTDANTIDADVDGDGEVDIFDVNQIIGVMLGNGTVPEPEQIVMPETYIVNGVSFKMIPVQGGSFTMGATAEQGSDAYDSEKPAHQVTLSDYSIGQTEVTQELWQAVMGSDPSKFIGNLQRPVERVSWNDCQTFITKLNQLTGKNFRLPTEAEWEYAARGGNRSQGYKYAGSNTIGDVAWWGGNSSSTTHPVATKAPNELGLYDMSGNVWEWCQDWYSSSYYSSSPTNNPTGPTSGSFRVYRGGCWYFSAECCRVWYRNYNTTSFTSYDLGLRLAL